MLQRQGGIGSRGRVVAFQHLIEERSKICHCFLLISSHSKALSCVDNRDVVYCMVEAEDMKAFVSKSLDNPRQLP